MYDVGLPDSFPILLFYLNVTSLLVGLSLLPAQDLCMCSCFFLGWSPLIGLCELLFIKYSFIYLYYSIRNGLPFSTEIRLAGVICLGIAIASQQTWHKQWLAVRLFDGVCPLVPLSSPWGEPTPADPLVQGGGHSHDPDPCVIFNLVPGPDKHRLNQLSPGYLPQRTNYVERINYFIFNHWVLQ